jgi:hypothetical protein
LQARTFALFGLEMGGEYLAAVFKQRETLLLRRVEEEEPCRRETDESEPVDQVVSAETIGIRGDRLLPGATKHLSRHRHHGLRDTSDWVVRSPHSAPKLEHPET